MFILLLFKKQVCDISDHLVCIGRVVGAASQANDAIDEGLGAAFHTMKSLLPVFSIHFAHLFAEILSLEASDVEGSESRIEVLDIQVRPVKQMIHGFGHFCCAVKERTPSVEMCPLHQNVRRLEFFG